MRPGPVDDAKGSATAGAARARRLGVLAGLAAFASLLVLTRPYRGIVQDAEIYIGQALAAADPSGLGQDILFAFDDQFRFSLWPVLARHLVERLGPDAAAIGLTACGLVLWAVSCAALAFRLLPPCCRIPGLLAAATLPPLYGGFAIFRYAEAMATPRALAEALVLAALACLLAGRRVPAASCLLAGAAIHPIMALPGLAVAVLSTAGTVRRGALLVALVGLVLLAGAAAGLPVLSRLFVVPDPAWAEALAANPYLFPSRWAVQDWCAVALGAATILVGRQALRERARAIAGLVVLVGIRGLLATLVLGDALGSLLVLQVQPWRALWLMALFAALLLPAALVTGWRAGAGRSVAAALLALAWLVPDAPAAAALAVLALGLDEAARRDLGRFGPRAAAGAWLVAGAVLAVVAARRILAAAALFGAVPADAGSPIEVAGVWLPLAAAATLWAARRSARPAVPAVLAGAAFLAVLAVAAADGRSRLAARLDAGRPDPDLVRLLPDAPGPILWLGLEPRRSWVLAGRPNWVGYVQGAPMVFSRPLARIWSDRMDRLLAAGLADASDRSPHLARPGASLHPGAAAIAAFCAAPDAPLAIVVPLSGHVVPPPERPGRPYRLPVPGYEADLEAATLGWTIVDRHAVLPCRDTAGP